MGRFRQQAPAGKHELGPGAAAGPAAGRRYQWQRRPVCPRCHLACGAVLVANWAACATKTATSRAAAVGRAFIMRGMACKGPIQDSYTSQIIYVLRKMSGAGFRRRVEAAAAAAPSVPSPPSPGAALPTTAGQWKHGFTQAESEAKGNTAGAVVASGRQVGREAVIHQKLKQFVKAASGRTRQHE